MFGNSLRMGGIALAERLILPTIFPIDTGGHTKQRAEGNPSAATREANLDRRPTDEISIPIDNGRTNTMRDKSTVAAQMASATSADAGGTSQPDAMCEIFLDRKAHFPIEPYCTSIHDNL